MSGLVKTCLEDFAKCLRIFQKRLEAGFDFFLVVGSRVRKLGIDFHLGVFYQLYNVIAAYLEIIQFNQKLLCIAIAKSSNNIFL